MSTSSTMKIDAQLPSERSEVGNPTSVTEYPRGVPDCITILAGSLTFNGSVHGRGDRIQLTGKVIASTVDRSGHSFLSDLSDEAQITRWGRVMLAPGDCSEELARIDRDAASALETVKAKLYEDSGLQSLRDAWAEEAQQIAGPRILHQQITYTRARS